MPGVFVPKFLLGLSNAGADIMTANLFQRIGFEGEPDLQGDELGKEEEISREEVSKAAEIKKDTPIKERGIKIHNRKIDGLIIKDLGASEDEETIKKGLENLSVDKEEMTDHIRSTSG